MLSKNLAGKAPQFTICQYLLNRKIKVLAPSITLTIGLVLSNENRGLSRGSPK